MGVNKRIYTSRGEGSGYEPLSYSVNTKIAKPGVSWSITGYKLLDARLALLEKNLRNKYIRQALRQAVKTVKSRAERVTPVRTGAMRGAYVVRANKRSRVQAGVAVMITRKSLEKSQNKADIAGIRRSHKDNRESQIKAIRAEHNDTMAVIKQRGTKGRDFAAIRKSLGGERDAKIKEIRAASKASLANALANRKQSAFRGFYPAFVEYGSRYNQAMKPMRAALYGSQDVVKQLFAAEVRKLLNSQ